MPDDEEGKRLFKLAQKADKEEESYYRKAMHKKVEQSRMAQLQAPPKRGKKPPVSEESVEKAVEKRKAPFMYRPDYNKPKKWTEEEEVVLDMMHRGLFTETGSTESYVDGMDTLLRKMKEWYDEDQKSRHPYVKQPRGEIANTGQREMKNLSKTARSGFDIRESRPFERLIDKYGSRLPRHKFYEAHPEKAKMSFLDFLKYQRAWRQKLEDRLRAKELPHVPEPGSEEYYFGKEKK